MVPEQNSPQVDLPPVDRLSRPTTHLRRFLAIFQLALVAAPWKLWTPQTVFPQVPLLEFACDLPGWCDGICLAGLVSSSTLLLFLATHELWSRISTGVVVISLAGLFLLDQHRLQPWAWQFFLLAILLTLADDQTARRGWMWLAISIYFWSAVSKLDYTFFHQQGPALLGGLKKAAGLLGGENRWTQLFDIAGSMLFVGGEFGVSLLLMVPRTRWLGLWGAIGMHLTLLATLGPFGLNHSKGVLLWNLFFIGQAWLLFHTTARAGTASLSISRRESAWRIWNDCRSASGANRAAMAVILLAVLWPSLESFGLCDHWLAWSVYSARPGHANLQSSTQFDAQRFRIPYYDQTTWDLFEGDSPDAPIHRSTRYLNLAEWSLQELGVPIYPESRFQVGVAWSLARERQLRGRLELIPAGSRFTGEPLSESTYLEIGPAAQEDLERIASTYNWNARPRNLTVSSREAE